MLVFLDGITFCSLRVLTNRDKQKKSYSITNVFFFYLLNLSHGCLQEELKKLVQTSAKSEQTHIVRKLQVSKMLLIDQSLTFLNQLLARDYNKRDWSRIFRMSKRPGRSTAETTWRGGIGRSSYSGIGVIWLKRRSKFSVHVALGQTISKKSLELRSKCS